MSEQVSKWLDGLGLGQYQANFIEHQVGMQILTEIGDADLREMGVSALGHRKALLKANPICTAPSARCNWYDAGLKSHPKRMR